ncbi:CD40 ligand [Lampris incognitus]|uniref:CD40 ligand n=1 Tax=Lampris incognitus TaxID=2546036 RepID=UPI0024B5CCDB|nr:CD40 ligand [Lampris incognitus]
MINTYQTSLPPPPVPPRHRSDPVLLPAPGPSNGNGMPLLRFLVVVVTVHMLLSLGGFVYLYHSDKRGKIAPAEAQAELLLSKETSHIAMARMVVKPLSHTSEKLALGYLQWNIDHSVRSNINYYRGSWLTVLEPGNYYVYARVTFSKQNKGPLASWVKLRQSETGEEKNVMKAYCDLGSHSIGLCTATQGEVMTLKAGNQLSVWVQDLSLVDYEEGATTFGMYKL